MTVPSVTYTGEEIALIAGFIAHAMPALGEQDHEVADLLLDRAISAIMPLAPDVLAALTKLREQRR